MHYTSHYVAPLRGEVFRLRRRNERTEMLATRHPKPMGKQEETGVAEYAGFLQEVKQRIAQERVRVVLSANTAMVLLYWDLGRVILQRQEQEGWGAKVIDRLSQDLRSTFPEMTGLSARNLKYMRQFAEAWPKREIVQRTVAQIPWRSNQMLLDKLSDSNLVRSWGIKALRCSYKAWRCAINNWPAFFTSQEIQLG